MIDGSHKLDISQNTAQMLQDVIKNEKHLCQKLKKSHQPKKKTIKKKKIKIKKKKIKKKLKKDK